MNSNNNTNCFSNTYIKIRCSGGENSNHMSVLEHHASYGNSPPLHIHHSKDDLFVVLSGEFRFVIQGETHFRKAGVSIMAPKGIPHAYRVESPEGGKWLTITTGHNFERFIRTVAQLALTDSLPEQQSPKVISKKTTCSKRLTLSNRNSWSSFT